MKSLAHPQIVVVGSVNLDLVARVERLPVPGETLTDARLDRYPGGKGANQALAARRLGAEVSLVACVGVDAFADEALALLREGEVRLDQCIAVDDEPTGIALIYVDGDGENQIVVAPGANRSLEGDKIEMPAAAALIGQLEVPIDSLTSIATKFDGRVCVNLAPAREVPDALIDRANVIIVNETEAAFYGDRLNRGQAIVVTTLGAAGAVARRAGREVGRAEAPAVNAIDTVGAGDTFTAAFVVALETGKPIEEALEFACRAAALATTKQGAQPALPFLNDL